MKLKIIIHPEEGGFWAEVPALKGCYSQGDTLEEVRANIREAIACYLDESDTPVPAEAHMEEIEL